MHKHAAMLRWDVLFKHGQLLWRLLCRHDGRVHWDEQWNEQRLDDNRLGDVGMEALVRAAMPESLPSLTSLELSANATGPASARAIRELLEHPRCALRALRLAEADIDDDECVALVESMQRVCNAHAVAHGAEQNGTAGSSHLAAANGHGGGARHARGGSCGEDVGGAAGTGTTLDTTERG